MLTQLMRHRWIFLVQGGLTFLLGLELVSTQRLLPDAFLGTFVDVVALLSIGFVLVSAGLLNLIIAVKELNGQHKFRSSATWWVPGVIGIFIGLFVILFPGVNMRFLAFAAAVHALVVIGIDLAMLPWFNRRTLQRNLLTVSALFAVILGVLLAIGGMGTEQMATRALGFYALYFGVRLICLGFVAATPYQTPVHVS